MEFENLGQLYFPFLKIFYDEKKKHVHTPIILSQECQDFCHDTKKQVRVFQGGFITAQLINFSLQLRTTFLFKVYNANIFFI